MGSVGECGEYIEGGELGVGRFQSERLTFAFGAWLLWRSERKQFQKGALLEGEVVDFYDCYVVKNVEVEIAKALL